MPEPGGEKSLYEVRLVVLGDSDAGVDLVLKHVISACLQHPFPLPTVFELGASVKNLTLSGRRAAAFSKGMSEVIVTGFKNKPVPKAGTVDILYPKGSGRPKKSRKAGA